MIAALVLAAAAAPTVTDADLAFARLAQEQGQWTAFRSTATPDAIWFTPRPSSVQDDLKDAQDPAKSVAWWPIEAWQSCDGTLGVTTGGALWPDGHASRYTTIWRRQPDGGWKWIYDNGQNLAAPLPRSKPRFVRASCKTVAEPMTFPRPTGREQGAGGSKDGTLVYWWIIDAGAHSLKVRMWDGGKAAIVHERNVPAPPVKLAPGGDAPIQ